MKTQILGVLTLCASLATPVTLIGQTATVYLKSGEKIVYSSEDLDYIQFSDETPFQDDENILTPAMMPDDELRNYINENLAGGLGVFTVEEAANYNKPLDLSDCTGITSLKGLEFFTSLKTLDISYLSSLDTSTIPMLKSLTSLKAAHLSMNPAKFNFAKSFPELQKLTVSYSEVEGPWTFASEKLTDLICDGCLLSSLDVSGCPELRQLVCSTNQLTSIDISGCSKIEELYVQYNSQLGKLDLTGIGSQLIGLNVAQTGISDLDVTGCVSLVDLELQDNFMYGRVLDFTGCPKLSHLRCENSYLAGIKVSGLAELNDLNCYNNQFTELDLSGCSGLTLVNAFSNSLSSIITEGCHSIYQLNIANNTISSLDVTGFAETLSVLGVTNNQLSEIVGIEDCTALSDINFNQNNLTSLRISNCPQLQQFQCSDNALETLEVINCPAVLNMDIYGNKLSRFDLTGMSMDVFTTGMFFFAENLPNFQIKVWPDFDINDIPSRWYGDAEFVYEFTND